MKEHNYTIPINEAIEAHVPCFLCKIEEDLEKNALGYYMGAAVMEPSVRVEMNQKGFCRKHTDAMHEMNTRKLPLALAMETRLHSIQETLEKQKKLPISFIPTCVVCDRVDAQMEKCIENCLWLLRHEAVFFEKYKASEGVCVQHFYRLAAGLRRKENELYKMLHTHMTDKLARLGADINKFRNMFDYRNEDKSWEGADKVLPYASAIISSERK